MPQLMTVGEILVEMMADQVGQTFLSPGCIHGPYPSGAPAIMIDQAARMGADCGIVACVGADDFGRMNIQRLEADGVVTRGIVTKADETTGVAFVGYAADGSRGFIFHFAHAAAGSLKPEEVDETLLDDVKIFHVMGCSLSASQSLRKAVLRAARLAKEKGALVSFDPNIRPELLKLEAVRRVFAQMLEECDILLTGRKELIDITGMEADAAIEKYAGKNKYALVIKDGSRGARILAGGKDERIPSYSVAEVDPTGAGDCFDGAFLASLLEGKTLREAARIGNAAGALSVTRRGPMEGAHYREEVLEFMGNNEKIQ